MGRKRKEDHDEVDVFARNGEHPVITEVLKATAEDQDPLIGCRFPRLQHAICCRLTSSHSRGSRSFAASLVPVSLRCSSR